MNIYYNTYIYAACLKIIYQKCKSCRGDIIKQTLYMNAFTIKFVGYAGLIITYLDINKLVFYELIMFNNFNKQCFLVNHAYKLIIFLN